MKIFNIILFIIFNFPKIQSFMLKLFKFMTVLVPIARAIWDAISDTLSDKDSTERMTVHFEYSGVDVAYLPQGEDESAVDVTLKFKLDFENVPKGSLKSMKTDEINKKVHAVVKKDLLGNGKFKKTKIKL